jgi:hypothetical protein
VPGKHPTACGRIFQSQPASRHSGHFCCSRAAGEVSARARNQSPAMQLHAVALKSTGAIRAA